MKRAQKKGQARTGSSQIDLGQLDTLRDQSPRFRRRPRGTGRDLADHHHGKKAPPRSHAPRGNAVFDALRRALGSRAGTRSVRDGIPTRSVGTRGKCQLGHGLIGPVWDDPRTALGFRVTGEAGRG